ncbi:MAG: hypothetical protein M0P13_05700 [Fibrobacteraceae bacterium]|nr:hypothetical protein [Fibrobacteraceae bacterium]
MSSLDADILSVKGHVETLRKSARFPYWRLSYADFSLLRIADYCTVGEEDEAKEMVARLARWVDSHLRELNSVKPPSYPHLIVWNEKELGKEIATVRRTIDSKKYLIPAAERENFSRSLERVEKLVVENKLEKAHSEILSLRSGLVSRLHRSYRARLAVIYHNANIKGFGNPVPEGVSVGLYNAERTLAGALNLIGERDAIWIEDFLELYDSLSKVADRLAPLEKKKR